MRPMHIAGESTPVAIRLVETTDRIDKACDLINDRYSWRGYGNSHRVDADSHHATFTAEVDDEVVGTITLAVDSPDGLGVDRAFRNEVDDIRRQSAAVVCELTKFAFDPAVQSKELIAALFHIVFVYGSRTYGGTDLMIEVNPRHVRFYQSMLGFQKIGSLKVNESVAAPAQLMWLKVEEIRASIERATETGSGAKNRSLYPLFFSPKEEEGIYQRLTNGVGGPARYRAAARPERTPVESELHFSAAMARARRGFAEALASA